MSKKSKTILLIMIITYLTADIYAEVKLRTQAEVEAFVDSITGFKDINGITKSFKMVEIHDDNTPFLHTQINGRKNVWVAEYKNFHLELKSMPGADTYNRDFKIYIDANDGTLLKITSKYEEYDPNIVPEPNASHAEKDIKSVADEYLGFPKEPPKTNFLEAFNDLRVTPYGFVFQAKEIYALYIWFSTMGREPRRAWAFSFRGMPPTVYSPPFELAQSYVQPPVWGRNYIRVVVDDETGKSMSISNVPLREDPNKTKK